ncbi:MAG: exonuclease subunit SbcD [Bacteroidota bacterium]
MKILHTADWHIGKVLLKQSLVPELEMFLDWLIKFIKREEIDVLLVSGDIFDIANPSVKDREVYYRFLSRLIGLNIQVIITGGNHDSVGLIDAPQEILKHIRISVVGGAKKELQDELIEIKGKEGEIELIAAAVPFLRDKDLRNLYSDKEFESRTEALQFGIQQHYNKLAELISSSYPDVPALAMGHLYAKGASTSDSERDIHIGNAAAVESSIFPDRFGYVALGHIHRPQIIGGNLNIRYSGSPIALSFSEKEDKKCVLVVELKEGKFLAPEVIEVPKMRQLLKMSGTFDEVCEKLEVYAPEFTLKSFVELDIKEEAFSALLLSNVEQLISDYAANENFSILKSKTTFLHGAKDTSDLFEKGDRVEDLKPMDVFEKLLENETASTEKQDMLKDAFIELLESIHHSDSL